MPVMVCIITILINKTVCLRPIDKRQAGFCCIADSDCSHIPVIGVGYEIVSCRYNHLIVVNGDYAGSKAIC